MATLEPGVYTAILNGVGNTNGVGIVEVFEVDRELRDRSREGRLYYSVVQKWCTSVPLTPPIGTSPQQLRY